MKMDRKQHEKKKTKERKKDVERVARGLNQGRSAAFSYVAAACMYVCAVGAYEISSVYISSPPPRPSILLFSLLRLLFLLLLLLLLFLFLFFLQSTNLVYIGRTVVTTGGHIVRRVHYIFIALMKKTKRRERQRTNTKRHTTPPHTSPKGKG